MQKIQIILLILSVQPPPMRIHQALHALCMQRQWIHTMHPLVRTNLIQWHRLLVEVVEVTEVAAGAKGRARGLAEVAQVGPVMGVSGAGMATEADWVDLVRGEGTHSRGGWEGLGEERGGTGG